jgi:D-alanine-D-alanine ligase-like ATP-grasp enzyme
MGKGVFVGLRNQTELQNALAASEPKKALLLEQYIQGDEYRVYLIGGRFVTACKRLPAQVVGDGKSSINSLIKKKNSHKKSLGFDPVKQDAQLELALSQQQLTLTSVPLKDQVIFLGQRLGRSSGGDIHIAAQDFSKENIKQLELLAQQFSDRATLGVDVILASGQLYVLEVNTRLQLSSALLPDVGQSVALPEKLIEYFFPNSKRIGEFQFFHAKAVLNQFKRDPASNIIIDSRTSSEQGYFFCGLSQV